MILSLNDDYRINVSSMNFTLEQSYTVKEGDNAGQERWKTLGYYSGFESVLRAIPDHLAQHPDVVTFEDFMGRWKALAKDVGGRFGK